MKSKKAEPTRKLFGLRLDKALMAEIQHASIDEDRYVNELVEEALRDLLKKNREKRKEVR